jgi:hypothetical protein
MKMLITNNSCARGTSYVVTVASTALLLLGTSACAERHSSERGRELGGPAASQARVNAVASARIAKAEEPSPLPAALTASVVQVRSVVERRRARCQGVALTATTVVTAKHCADGTVDVRPWASAGWVRAVGRTPHALVDLAVLQLSLPLPIEDFASLTDECAVDRPLLAACYRGLGSASSELEPTRVEQRCSTPRDCFSDTLELAPGASGCPLFDEMTGRLAALGVASLKESSRTVCLSRAVVAEMTNATVGPR